MSLPLSLNDVIQKELGFSHVLVSVVTCTALSYLVTVNDCDVITFNKTSLVRRQQLPCERCVIYQQLDIIDFLVSA